MSVCIAKQNTELRQKLHSGYIYSLIEDVQQFHSYLLINVLLLQVLGSLTALLLMNRPEVAKRATSTFAAMFALCWIILGWLVWQQVGEGSGVIEWSMRLPGGSLQNEFLSSIAIRFDFLRLPLLVLLPFIHITCCQLTTLDQRFSPLASMFLLTGSSMLIVANDVMSLFTAATIITLSLDFLTRNQSRPVHCFQFYTAGWFCIFAGLAWMVASAAIVRAAPHGLPGASTTILSNLVQLIERSSHQHPAAGFVWRQYQLLPTISILIGVSFIGGIVPFHSAFARFIEGSTLQTRLWAIAISKIVLVLLFSLLIRSDPESWSNTANTLAIPVMLGFVYSSLLLFAKADRARRLSRLVIWSQQVTLLSFVTLSESGISIVLLTSCTHLAALTLFCLHLAQVESRPIQYNRLVPLVGVMSLTLTFGATGLLLLWGSSLTFSTADSRGALKFVVFIIGLLISIGGMLRFLTSDEEFKFYSVCGDTWGTKSLLVGWCFIAILSSLTIPVVAQAIETHGVASRVVP